MNTFRVAAVLLLAVLCAAGWGTAPANAAQLVLDTDPKEQLLTACQSGDKTELAMALTNGADINAKDMVRHRRCLSWPQMVLVLISATSMHMP